MSVPLGPVRFDVCGALPHGVTVLEASAGTGKTWTIATLAARYVAEGLRLDGLLLMTFTRMATGELRERVRERLVEVEAGIAAVLDDGAPPAEPIIALLAHGPEAPLRRRRLTRALADFDAATITTTHGFCQEVLGSLGVAGDLERDPTFAEDLSDLVSDVVDDLFVRRFAPREVPAFTRDQALKIARAVTGNPGAPLAPAQPGGVGEMRRKFAIAVRAEFERRKLHGKVMTYDDLLSRLRGALEHPVGGAEVARIMRARWSVVLVDEFQDTDPDQWEVVRLAFGERPGGDGSALVLIGDPKQAIYAFRGADVHAYLRAAASAGTRATLDVNWRTDQPLLDAYDALLAGARLGHPGITVRPVEACEANKVARLQGAPVDRPLRVRVLGRESGVRKWGQALSPVAAKERIAEDLAGEVAALLASGADIAGEPIAPGDLAVLVQTNRDAALVRDGLDAAGIPAVINGAGSVFATAPAREWLRLLEALERPTYEPRARAAALTSFLGWTAEEVAAAGDATWEQVHQRLHAWARVLRDRGVASLLEAITLGERLPGRVLRTADGERKLTDLRHLGQLLHVAATSEQLGPTALTAWLRQRIAAAEEEQGDEERSRRLESDAAAVQVLTVHRAKGLEFPVVLLPFLWNPGFVPRTVEPVAFHDAAADDVRTLDVTLEGPGFTEHKRRSFEEKRGEDLRLAYVALTRARHQTIVWWASAKEAGDSPLGRLLFARQEDGTVRAEGGWLPKDDAIVEGLEALGSRVSVERAIVRPAVAYDPPAGAPEVLTTATFDRELDLRWRRTSYSAITAEAHEPRVASEPEDDDVLHDEPDDASRDGSARPVRDGPSLDGVWGEPSPLADMPGGVHVGTFVHHVLEAADFDAPDLEAELGLRVDEELARRPVDVGDRAVLVRALAGVLATPLAPLGGAPLRGIARADRLDELGFELPLVGGDDPTGRLPLDALAAVLRRHGEGALAGYADRLEDPALRREVRGYLTGSLDLVVRTADGRFAIFDHKTNRLAGPDEPLTLGHHRPEHLAAEMRRSHYGLQALLYVVALHRYLRWRLDGYDPDVHLAGVGYLFVRGMAGPETPAGCGVFAWHPPGALVTELSDVLDQGVPA